MSRVNREAKLEAYRAYVTDSLKAIAENTARYAGGGYIKARYVDIIHPKPQETRTADEIIGHMKGKLSPQLKQGGESA